MKITKKMLKSFEGLEKLEKMQKEGYCTNWPCLKCPLNSSNINGTINGNKIDCSDIIDLSLYRAKDPEIVNRINKLIDIFTKENINSILAKRVIFEEKTRHFWKKSAVFGEKTRHFWEKSAIFGLLLS